MFTTRRRGLLDGAERISVKLGALRPPRMFAVSASLHLTVDGLVDRSIFVTADTRRPALVLPFQSVSFGPRSPGDVLTHTFEVTNEGTDVAAVQAAPSGAFTVSPSSFTLAPGGSTTLTITVPVTAATQFPLAVQLSDGCTPTSGTTYEIDGSLVP
jgi:hypothetical protein